MLMKTATSGPLGRMTRGTGPVSDLFKHREARR